MPPRKPLKTREDLDAKGSAAANKAVANHHCGGVMRMIAMVSTVTWNSRVLFYVSLLLSLCLVMYSYGGPHAMLGALTGGPSLKEVSFLNEPMPKEADDFLRERSDEIRVDSRTTQIMGSSVHYLESHPASALPSADKTILLLHGMAFKAETWQQEGLATVQTMAALGYRVIALDLPGFGESAKNDDADPGEFLSTAIQTLTPGKAPVVVSPSMSGRFSLPVLMQSPYLMCGYVPVAPVLTETYDKAAYESVRVPTLIIFGEMDTNMGLKSAKNLAQIPTSSKAQVIPGARHPCYLDNPKMFHLMIHNFVKKLNC